MNDEHKSIDQAPRDDARISKKKAYNPPNLLDLDNLEKTEGGTNPFIFEATNGMATS
jgi:hypothetical protein